MGLEMGVMGLVALPREQCHSLHQQRLWNRESDTVHSQGPVPSEILLELQSLGVPKQWGNQNEPDVCNPDVTYWKNQLFIGHVAFGKDLNGGDGDRHRGFLFLGFSWALLSLQISYPLWSALVAQKSIPGGCKWPPQGIAPAMNVGARRGVELLPWASWASAARISWVGVKYG